GVEYLTAERFQPRGYSRDRPRHISGLYAGLKEPQEARPPTRTALYASVRRHHDTPSCFMISRKRLSTSARVKVFLAAPCLQTQPCRTSPAQRYSQSCTSGAIVPSSCLPISGQTI